MSAPAEPPIAESPPAAFPRWVGAVSGLVGAGVALAFGELVAGFTSSVPSLVVAVGEAVVDHAPASIVEAGIDAAGTNDKPILLAVITVASLAIGALLGVAARHRRTVSDLGFALFGLVGAWAAQRNPFASTTAAVLTSLTAGALGAATVRGLLGIASMPQTRVPPTPAPAATSRGFVARRVFLGAGTTAALVAVAGAVAGRAMRAGRNIAAARDAITLPPARATSANPPAGPAAATLGATPPGALDTAVSGISPYVTPATSFYRIDTALVVPQIDPARWKLQIGGLVDRPYALTYDELLAMDLVEETVTLACVSNNVGGRYVGNAVWRGIPLTTLLDRAGVQPAGAQIAGISVDGFDASFPTELARDGRTALLAIGMNGEPLPVEHGFPARLVVAGLYGYVSAVKWLREIRLVDAGYDAYWIPRGWSKLGPIKTQSRIDVPRGSKVTAGPQVIGGVAWAPGTGVSRVEVQIDDGEWQTCRLGDATSDETWVQWMLPWEATPGRHRIRVRATDRSGSTQSGRPVDPAPNGAEGWHTVTVNVV